MMKKYGHLNTIVVTDIGLILESGKIGSMFNSVETLLESKDFHEMSIIDKEETIKQLYDFVIKSKNSLDKKAKTRPF